MIGRPAPLIAAVASALLALGATVAAAPEPEARNHAPPTLGGPARKLVTLAPHLAELAHAAGAGELLVGTVAYSDYPEAARDVPRIGDAFRFDLERIMALAPDLVIAWDSGNPEPALRALEDLGLTVWRTEVRSPEDIAGLIEAFGEVTGRPQPAIAAATAVRERLRRLRDDHRERTLVSFFYQVAERPLYTINGDHLISRALAICGGENVFAGLGSLAPQITVEAVLQHDPRILLAGRLQEGGRPLEHWRAWPRLRAVRDDALYYLNADEMNRATPRMLDSLERACSLFDEYRARHVTADPSEDFDHG